MQVFNAMKEMVSFKKYSILEASVYNECFFARRKPNSLCLMDSLETVGHLLYTVEGRAIQTHAFMYKLLLRGQRQ